MTDRLFSRIALIGLGLIGSSLARAIKAGALAEHVAGYDVETAVRRRSRELGFVDSLHDHAETAVRGAELVILCIPVGACGKVARDIAPALREGAIVSDVGSVKTAVARSVAPHIPQGANFVPGHPIAGTEKSGPDAGFAELFEGRWCILTPLPDSDPQAVGRLCAFWRGCGSRVDIMDPDHHDRVLGLTSHLPQLIAFSIVTTARTIEEITQAEVIKYSAAGFRDFTRLAASDPIMWRDVYLNNGDAVIDLIDHFIDDLQRLRGDIESRNGPGLQQTFARARGIRQRIIDAGQDSPAVNFGRSPASLSGRKSQTS